MDDLFGSILTLGGVVVAEYVKVDLKASVLVSDAIFDPTKSYIVRLPEGEQKRVRFVGQAFTPGVKEVHFRHSLPVG